MGHSEAADVFQKQSYQRGEMMLKTFRLRAQQLFQFKTNKDPLENSCNVLPLVYCLPQHGLRFIFSSSQCFLGRSASQEGAKKQGLLPKVTSQRDVFLSGRLQTQAERRGKMQMTGASHFYRAAGRVTEHYKRKI